MRRMRRDRKRVPARVSPGSRNRLHRRWLLRGSTSSSSRRRRHLQCAESRAARSTLARTRRTRFPYPPVGNRVHFQGRLPEATESCVSRARQRNCVPREPGVGRPQPRSDGSWSRSDWASAVVDASPAPSARVRLDQQALGEVQVRSESSVDRLMCGVEQRSRRSRLIGCVDVELVRVFVDVPRDDGGQVGGRLGVEAVQPAVALLEYECLRIRQRVQPLVPRGRDHVETARRATRQRRSAVRSILIPYAGCGVKRWCVGRRLGLTLLGSLVNDSGRGRSPR